MTIRPEFNASLKIKAAKENQKTSDAGVLVTREVIEKTGLIPYLTEKLHDPRDPCRIKHSPNNAAFDTARSGLPDLVQAA